MQFNEFVCYSCAQGEAIAHNLRTMFGLKVPIVSVVIGEGGSGGALAIGCANKLLMLENAVFYVARYFNVLFIYLFSLHFSRILMFVHIYFWAFACLGLSFLKRRDSFYQL